MLRRGLRASVQPSATNDCRKGDEQDEEVEEGRTRSIIADVVVLVVVVVVIIIIIVITIINNIIIIIDARGSVRPMARGHPVDDVARASSNMQWGVGAGPARAYTHAYTHMYEDVCVCWYVGL